MWPGCIVHTMSFHNVKRTTLYTQLPSLIIIFRFNYATWWYATTLHKPNEWSWLIPVTLLSKWIFPIKRDIQIRPLNRRKRFILLSLCTYKTSNQTFKKKSSVLRNKRSALRQTSYWARVDSYQKLKIFCHKF